MTPKEKAADILDVLEQVIGIAKVPMLESEKRAIAGRLVPYHGIELFRLLRGLPGRNYFPTCYQIEQEIRVILGEKPLRGLTDDLIAKNERENVVSGQAPAKAAAGAAMMRNTLRRRETLGETLESLKKKPEPKKSPLAELEEFGEVKNPLAELEEF